MLGFLEVVENEKKMSNSKAIKCFPKVLDFSAEISQFLVRNFAELCVFF